MNIDLIIGDWSLISGQDIDGGIFDIFGDDDLDEDSANDIEVSEKEVLKWLKADEDVNLNDMQRDGGLKLSIDTNLNYREVSIHHHLTTSLDHEGVCTKLSEENVFSGRIISHKDELYLEPSSMNTQDCFEHTVYTRVNDGDTIVSEKILIKDNHLIRICSRITDLLYCDRFILVYTKVK